MTGGQGHWLDELAVRVTRGGFLRSAVLAAGGLAFPLMRPRDAAAAANDPTACRKGCYFMAHKTAQRELAGCTTSVRAQVGTDLVTLLWLSPLLGFETLALAPSVSGCQDRVLLAKKAAMYDCLQPNCPGFDPAQAGGPCENCTAAGGHCCPDQKVVAGYSCCTGTGGCCDPSGDGCASGVTACGG